PEAVSALEEALRILRLFWSGERTINFAGRFYSVHGLHPGPAPAHRISVWIGGYKPRMLRLTGRLADGWIPPLLSYTPPGDMPALQRRIDEAAQAEGRAPRDIRRIYNLPGEIADGPTRSLLQGPVAHWVETLTHFALEVGFDTFVFWPSTDPVHQTERFAQEIVPAVRSAVTRARTSNATVG
ncbi:MAG TPA: LLM class flavin-dependent oxidoreductase, partial [bacterium]|nr:LLM class flavin-dependent oxidoreductase [bacterium]